MSMTSESDERLIPKNSVDSPSLDDANSGGSGGGSVPLKKGPWTSTEDATLIEYVTKHGEGNWNAVQKHSGLARCGKSCRLRWANHLRPDLKKGAFTPEEEHRIIELHAKMGNKWARMAAELPGRTDNEIKNYWNTRSKRRQRAGLPPYPPEIRLQAIKENQQIDDMNSFSSGDTHHSGFMPLDSFDIPSFGSLNQQFYPSPLLEIPAGSLLDMPPSSLLAPSLPSSYTHNCFLPTVHPSKRLRGSGPFLPGLNSAISNAISSGIQYQNVGSVQTGQPYNLSSSYDHHLTSTHAPFSSVVPGSHAALNGNPSSSEPAWAMKLELPSLQTQMGSLGSPSSPLPSLESVDTLIQTPPAEHTQICNLSPRNSGLLDAVLYESHTMKNTKTGSRQQTSHASDMAHNVMYSSSQDFYETEWEAYGETLSPLGHSSSSVFSEGTPFSGNSSDEPQSVETLPGFKAQNANLFPMQFDIKAETPDDLIFSRPDFLLASSCFSKGGTLPWTNPCSKMQ